MRSFGIDHNYDGEPVGLWFDREMIEMDEWGRISMTETEMEFLTNLLDDVFPDREV